MKQAPGLAGDGGGRESVGVEVEAGPNTVCVVHRVPVSSERATQARLMVTPHLVHVACREGASESA